MKIDSILSVSIFRTTLTVHEVISALQVKEGTLGDQHQVKDDSQGDQHQVKDGSLGDQHQVKILTKGTPPDDRNSIDIPR